MFAVPTVAKRETHRDAERREDAAAYIAIRKVIRANVQKHHMALYLSGIYANAKERAWFEKAWKATGKKLAMGSSCVRFKRLGDVPLDVVAQAVARVSVDDCIKAYEASRKKT